MPVLRGAGAEMHRAKKNSAENWSGPISYLANPSDITTAPQTSHIRFAPSKTVFKPVRWGLSGDSVGNVTRDVSSALLPRDAAGLQRASKR